jgi:hypothetical protein
MTVQSEPPHPIPIIMKVLHYAAFDEHCNELRPSAVRDALAVIFKKQDIDDAVELVCGRPIKSR